MHSLLLVRASKLPGLQGWQLVPPDRALNVPGVHSRHPVCPRADA